MENILLSFACLAAGILAGLAVSRTRARRAEAQGAELRGRLKSSEDVLLEVRAQAGQVKAELGAAQVERDRARAALVAAETRLEAAAKSVEEQKALLARAEEKLTAAFQALSGESLKSNNESFIKLAKSTLETVLSNAQGKLGEREQSIRNVVKSLDDALKRYELQVRELESKRAVAYGGLEAQVKALLSANQQLQKETGNLVSALKRPEVRGRWGEITLRRVVELAGMTEHCDFETQAATETGDGRLRPDMVVRLPAGRLVVVDSKVSLDAYVDSASADEARRAALIAAHARQMRRHMKDLSSREYWARFATTPEFVVMFVPGEVFLSAALSVDPTLIEDGMADHVIIATPTTLIALLRSVAFGWRQAQVARNAREIADLGREIHDRFQPFLEHVNRTGLSLAQATGAFNRMVSSLESRVLVSVRKLKDLGAAGGSELPGVPTVEQIPVPGRIAAPDSDPASAPGEAA